MYISYPVSPPEPPEPPEGVRAETVRPDAVRPLWSASEAVKLCKEDFKVCPLDFLGFSPFSSPASPPNILRKKDYVKR